MGKLRSLEERKKEGQFEHPTGLVTKHRLVDEAETRCIEDGAEFANMIQLLERQGGQQIRMTYYRRPEGGDDASWHFGGQTSLTLCAEDWAALFAQALKKPWFLSIVGEAMKRLAKDIGESSV
jgi:hypothetical protein